MKAFRRHAKEPRAARLEEVNVPEPGENEVLLRVSNCGICGSDLHAWLNHPGYEFVLEEVTFGHELSGIVEKVGPSVADWEIGDHAVMIALQTHHDDEDPYCRQGLPQLSDRRRVQGLHLDGGMAEFVAVHTEFLIPVPEGLDMRLAALTEPLSVAEHCIGNRSSIRQDDKVLVTGPGIIGAFCAISARHRGAEVVIAGTERDEKARLSALRSIGFPTLKNNANPLGDPSPELPRHRQTRKVATSPSRLSSNPQQKPTPIKVQPHAADARSAQNRSIREACKSTAARVNLCVRILIDRDGNSNSPVLQPLYTHLRLGFLPPPRRDPHEACF